VSARADVFLGVIAFAVLAIAIAQVGVVVAELKPFFGHLNAIGRDASRATSLATAQVERADTLFADVVVRVDRALNGLQSSIETPAREGRAIMSGFRAAFQAIRDIRHNGRGRQRRGDDEDALFI